MSVEEKTQLAKTSCNIIASASGEDATTRLKELNTARANLGEEPYSGSDEEIRDSIKFGICENLILNDPNYSSLIEENREIVAAELKRIDSVAAVTCSIMAESRNMDSAFRIKEINAARIEIGQEPFIDGDQTIKEAFKYGLCKQLVLNDPDFNQKLSSSKQIEQELNAERKRIAQEKAAAAQKAKYERETIPQKNWRDAILSDIGNFAPKLREIEFDYDDARLAIQYECREIRGYRMDLRYELKNNLGTLADSNPLGSCGGYNTSHFYTFNGLSDEILEAFSKVSDPMELIDSANISITGVYDLGSGSRNRKLRSQSFKPLERDAYLRDSIKITLQIP